MEKDFIHYEQALALKELGFDEPCLAVYNDPEFKWARHLNGWEDHELDNVINSIYAEGGFVTAPTFSQAFRWFREKHSIQATIEPTKDQHRFELGFNYWIWNTKTAEEWFTEPKDRPAGDYVFDSYEETELECLKKLIEIVKENK